MEDWEVRSFEAHVNGILAIRIDSILAMNGRLGGSKLRSSI